MDKNLDEFYIFSRKEEEYLDPKIGVIFLVQAWKLKSKWLGQQ
jgi:hypothetical protein